MEIVSGVFALEDFERAHALECTDTQTGLVASNPEQKEKIANKYAIKGQVMVVPQAKPINLDEVEKIPVKVNLD